MIHLHKVWTRELTENTLLPQTDADNLDSIGNLLEEKLDFHEALSECKCFRLSQSDVFHKHPSMDSSLIAVAPRAIIYW